MGEKGEGSGVEGEGSGEEGEGMSGERGRELGMGYPPVHPLFVSQTKHGIMQMKAPNYMPKINTKLAYCNIKIVIGPFFFIGKTHKHYGNH